MTMRPTKLLVLSALLSAGALLAIPSTSVRATEGPNADIVAGMSRERLARIGPAMKREIERGMFPGAVTLVARKGQIVHQEAHGFLDAAKTKPMTADAVFMLASMTKPITSVATMMMAEEGLLKLGDPISNWLPELKDMKVEVRRTGPDGQATSEDVKADDKVARLAETLDSDPQKQTMMKSYRITQDPAGKQYFKGGAGLVSTIADYYRFAQMVANGGELDGKRLLSKKTVEYMLSNHTIGTAGSPTASTGPGYGFGLGFAVRLQEGFAVAPGSTGDAMWAGAWGTSFTIDPKEQLVAVLMAQGPSNRVHTRMLFKNLIYGAMME
jgi:CubicO group peptidase (beta-lactamase class C family)